MKSLFYLALICFFVSSCDSNRLFEKNIRIDQNVWNIQNTPSFEYENIDTLSKQKLILNIRHSSSYPFSNLWLFIHNTTPDNIQTTDTLECILAQKDGQWIGSGLGDIWDLQVEYDTRQFNHQGSYQFAIEQAMRHGDLSKIDNLPGIMEIGLRIETSN